MTINDEGAPSLPTAPPAGVAENGTADVDAVAVTAHFDQMVKQGKLYYDYDFVTKRRRVNGFEFEFRISNALAKKPWTTSDESASDLFAGKGPRPGSDINIQGLEVKDLTPSHFLAFNGFSSYRPHFLLLTSDGYKRQWEALDIHDFTAVSAFLESAIAAQGGKGSDYLIFYNCRAEAGCSRVHKHLQAIPRESFDGNPWLNFDENPDAVPFAYHSDKTCGTDPAALLAAYQTGMQAVERTLGKETKLENGVPPHNMLMDRGRLVVIPRRAGGIEPLAANSGGMLGMIWTQSEEMMQRWLDVDPHKLLAVAGVPKLL